MKRSWERTLTAFIAAFACVSPSSAAGTTAGGFFRLEPSPRMAAMAGAWESVIADVESIFDNPAGLGFVRDLSFSASSRSGLDDVSMSNFGIALPLSGVSASNVGHFGTLGFGLQSLDYGEIERRSAGGEPLGRFDPKDGAFSISYGRPLSRYAALGLRLKLYDLDLDGSAANGVLGGGGILLRPWNRFNVGLAVNGIGDDIEFDEEDSPAPTTVTTGVGYEAQSRRWNAALGFAVPQDDDTRVRIGGEWWANPAIALRAGYDSRYDAGPGITTGVGIAIFNMQFMFFPLERFTLDYAFTPMDDLDNVHQFGISLKLAIL